MTALKSDSNYEIDNHFEVRDCDFENVLIFHHKTFSDERGMFYENFKNSGGCGMSWCKQINTSVSHRGVVRGFHAQMGKYCQGKLVSCIYGEVIDIIIDMRTDSNTFGKLKAYSLNGSDNIKSIWVPRGFLHGFQAVGFGDNVFHYMCDNVYEKSSEICINPLSVFKNFKIKISKNDTPIDMLSDTIISEKDLGGEEFLDFKKRIAENTELWYNTTS